MRIELMLWWWWVVVLFQLAMFLIIDHCAIPSLEPIPPLEPLHSWCAL